MKFRLLVLCAAFAGLTSISQVPARGKADTPLHWLLLSKAYASLKTDDVANHFFGGPETYLIGPGKGGGAMPAGPTPTRAYSSYAQIEKAFSNGTAPKTGAILYDNEKWSFTPDNEKAEPARYEQMAAGLAHAHGLLFIATPAMNLGTFLAPGGAPGVSAMSSKYLQLGIARDAAHAADVIDIQAQALQYDSAEYARVVGEAAQQARAANPHVIILAGLTTRSRRDGTPATADGLLQAVKATRGIVDGYWLNVPMKSEYCPNCGEFRPDIAIDFLHRLAADQK